MEKRGIKLFGNRSQCTKYGHRIVLIATILNLMLNEMPMPPAAPQIVLMNRRILQSSCVSSLLNIYLKVRLNGKMAACGLLAVGYIVNKNIMIKVAICLQSIACKLLRMSI